MHTGPGRGGDEGLLHVLSDGRFHSGAELGRRLGVSRVAVWKRLRRLEQRLGLKVQAVRGRGYRLERPLELLDADCIRGGLPPALRARVRVETHLSLDSTNARLLARGLAGAPSGCACFAEHQSAGRGRRGRGWVSPFGCNVYGSLLWRFDAGPAALGGLSLAVGAALAEAVERLAGVELGLKWPNDLLLDGRKLGGVLVEVRGEQNGPTLAVLGVGLNFGMPEGAATAIDQPWAELAAAAPGLSRNALASAVLEGLVRACVGYAESGLAPFLESWRGRDVLAGRPVRLHLAGGTESALARGVEESGALVVEQAGRLRRLWSGEVSLRPAAAPPGAA